MNKEVVSALAVVIAVISIVSTVFFYIMLEKNATAEEKASAHFEITTFGLALLSTAGIPGRTVIPILILVAWIWGEDIRRLLVPAASLSWRLGIQRPQKIRRE